MMSAMSAEMAMMVVGMLRHAAVERVRQRAEQHNAAAHALEEEAKRVDGLFAWLVTIMQKMVPGMVAPDPPQTAGEQQPQDVQPSGPAPALFVYLRAIGDCGEPHASVADALACARSRSQRGIPLSPEDERILAASHGTPSGASAKPGRGHIHLVTSEDAGKRAGGVGGVAPRRRVERGPFAREESVAAPIPDGAGESVLVDPPDDGGDGSEAPVGAP